MATMTTVNVPNIERTYSRDNPAHQAWSAELGEDLRKKIEATKQKLDEAQPGPELATTSKRSWKGKPKKPNVAQQGVQMVASTAEEAVSTLDHAGATSSTTMTQRLPKRHKKKKYRHDKPDRPGLAGPAVVIHCSPNSTDAEEIKAPSKGLQLSSEDINGKSAATAIVVEQAPAPTTKRVIKGVSEPLHRPINSIDKQEAATPTEEDSPSATVAKTTARFKTINKIQLKIIKAVSEAASTTPKSHQPGRSLKSIKPKHSYRNTSTFPIGNNTLQLIDLAYEIKKQIIEYAVLQSEPITVDAFFRTKNKIPGDSWRRGYGVMYTCRHFHDIGRPAYYSVNTFSVSLGLFSSCQRSMTDWPSVHPAVQINLEPALQYVQHVEVRRVHHHEYCGGPWFSEQWGNMVKLLLVFNHLLTVNIDTRDCEPSAECGSQDTTEPAQLKIHEALARTGIRCGWTKKEDTREGIKNGSLFVTMCGTQGYTSNNWALDEILRGLDKKRLPGEGDDSAPAEQEVLEAEPHEDEDGLTWV